MSKSAKSNVLFIFILLLFSSCKKNAIGPEDGHTGSINNTVKLTVCPELEVVQVKIARAAADTIPVNPYKYQLQRRKEGGSTENYMLFTLTGNDTLIYDNDKGAGLKQGTAYWYKVLAYRDSMQILDSSATVLTKTLQQSSHVIKWKIDTLKSGSGLRDIWGLNENDLWAVGGAELPDGGSTVIRWDGHKWYSAPICYFIVNSIFGTDKDNIWVVGNGYGDYAGIAKWENQNWKMYKINAPGPGEDTIYSLNSVWGSKANDVWAVGNNGTIVHWDGKTWKKIPGIDTTCSLHSVSGLSEKEVYAVGMNYDTWDWYLYYYNGDRWGKEYLGDNYAWRTSVWAAQNGNIYIAGMYPYVMKNNKYKDLILPGRRSDISSIRGSAINNIFSVGHFNEVFHYDGKTWVRIDTLYQYPEGGILANLIVFEKSVFIVGYVPDHPIIIRGELE